ncbi:MAG: adenylate/guanylate cyclase domain-containing protein [Planctomycetota bacterium]
MTTAPPPADPPRPWALRHPVLASVLCILVPNALGSVANILYNLLNIAPRLSPAQTEVFNRSILVYNLLVYPALFGCFIAWLLPAGRTLQRGARTPAEAEDCRRRVGNSPFVAAALASLGWLPCAFVFPVAIAIAEPPLPGAVWAHFALSTLVSWAIAATQGFFAVDLLVSRRFFGPAFGTDRVSEAPGLWRLPLSMRFLLVYLSTSLLPIASIVAITLASGGRAPLLYVAAVSVLFGLGLAWLTARTFLGPIAELHAALAHVKEGGFDVRLDVHRADELGALAEGFDEMLRGLRERERIRDTFGRSVGRHVATELLRQEHRLGGETRDVTILFLDIRDFTPLAARMSPTELVALLNRVFGPMIQAVWEERGEVLTFLGDGFVAVFGAPLPSDDHAERAVRAAGRMHERCDPGIRIGIGIHTGPVVAGSVGTPERKQYTIIGEAVNLASRIESYTKEAKRPILLSAETAARLGDGVGLDPIGPARLKGVAELVPLFAPRQA